MVKIPLWPRYPFGDAVVSLVSGSFDWEDFAAGDSSVIDIGWCDVTTVPVWKHQLSEKLLTFSDTFEKFQRPVIAPEKNQGNNDQF